MSARTLPPPPLADAVQRDILARYACGATATELIADGVDRALVHEVIRFAGHSRVRAAQMVRQYDERLQRLQSAQEQQPAPSPAPSPAPAPVSLESLARERDEARAELLAARRELAEARSRFAAELAEANQRVTGLVDRLNADGRARRQAERDRDRLAAELEDLRVRAGLLVADRDGGDRV